MEMRWAAISPVPTADCFRSTRSLNTAFQHTLDDYSAGIDIGSNAPVRPNRQTVSFRVDGAFHLAIYIKVFAAREFPFDHNRRANEGPLTASGLRRFGRFHERDLDENAGAEIGLYSTG